MQPGQRRPCAGRHPGGLDRLCPAQRRTGRQPGSVRIARRATRPARAQATQNIHSGALSTGKQQTMITAQIGGSVRVASDNGRSRNAVRGARGSESHPPCRIWREPGDHRARAVRAVLRAQRGPQVLTVASSRSADRSRANAMGWRRGHGRWPCRLADEACRGCVVADATERNGKPPFIENLCGPSI
jgi:hypothetical protein